MTARRHPFVAALAAACALLLPLACADPSALPFPQPSLLPADLPYLGMDEAIHYRELPQEYTDKLRSACRDCAALSFGGVRGMDKLTLARGEGKPQAEAVEKLLAALAAQPRWYERHWDDEVCPELGDIPGIRFLDAEGKNLFAVDIWPAGPAFALVDGSYTSLWELCRRHLPQPDAAAPVRTPFTTPTGIQLPDKPVYIGEGQLFCYLRMAPEEDARLRRALHECAEVELTINGLGQRVLRTLRLHRGSVADGGDDKNHQGKKLSDVLDWLATRPQWLEEWLYTDADVDPAWSADIRLLDAEGTPLWQGSADFICYQEQEGAAPRSFLSAFAPFLPFEL